MWFCVERLTIRIQIKGARVNERRINVTDKGRNWMLIQARGQNVKKYADPGDLRFNSHNEDLKL